MLQELNYSATDVSQTAIRQRRIELRGELPVTGICPSLGRLQQIFGDYLDYLERNLTTEASFTDIGQVQEMLLELAYCVRTNNNRIKEEQYSAILERLSGIYAQGMAQNTKAIYSATAADYADLIEAISRKHPTYDFSKMIGQLLFYMNQLFEQRKSSWITIYDHLRMMPDSIETIQSLKDGQFLEIQQWLQEGVENLFQIHEDFNSRIEQLNHEILEIAQKIREGKDGISSATAKLTADGETTVISLEVKRTEKEIDILAGQMNELVYDREEVEAILALIEENLKDFEDILTNTKRSFFIELVYDSAL